MQLYTKQIRELHCSKNSWVCSETPILTVLSSLPALSQCSLFPRVSWSLILQQADRNTLCSPLPSWAGGEEPCLAPGLLGVEQSCCEARWGLEDREQACRWARGCSVLGGCPLSQEGWQGRGHCVVLAAVGTFGVGQAPTEIGSGDKCGLEEQQRWPAGGCRVYHASTNVISNIFVVWLLALSSFWCFLEVVCIPKSLKCAVKKKLVVLQC